MDRNLALQLGDASRPLSVDEIARAFNAEVLSDAEAANVLERIEIARQCDLIAEWNRSVGERA